MTTRAIPLLCIGALLTGAAGANAQDPVAIRASYEALVMPAGVLATKVKERPRPLQVRAVATLRASRALLGTLGATPGAYPACGESVTRIAVGATRMSQGASLVKTAARLRGAARSTRVRLGRARITAGMMRLEGGLAQAGACRAQLEAEGMPPMPMPSTGGPAGPPGSAGPGGSGPPIFDFL